MLKGFKIRLFPTREQEKQLWKSAGVARWVWNWGLNLADSL
jgi:putative transposase